MLNAGDNCFITILINDGDDMMEERGTVKAKIEYQISMGAHRSLTFFVGHAVWPVNWVGGFFSLFYFLGAVDGMNFLRQRITSFDRLPHH